ncbi:MAG: hypothetical protein BKP49_07275 [Treponema sp. CETP13]|nr:MAG: hypothetical protein BKP49_07275 [Treponema sp. CETP13]
MKIEPAILIKDKQICNQNGELINIRGFTLDNSLPEDTSRPLYYCSLDEADPESTFEDIKKRGCSLIRWIIYWNVVEPEEGKFNEAYLAKLRDFIKLAEKIGLLVYLVPMISVEDKPFWGSNTYPADKMIDGEFAGFYYAQLFSEAMNHTARRIKDCENVIGFSLPLCYDKLMNTQVSSNQLSELTSRFMHLLHKKHLQYYFIAETAELYDAAKKNDEKKAAVLASIFLENNQVMLTY